MKFGPYQHLLKSSEKANIERVKMTSQGPEMPPGSGYFFNYRNAAQIPKEHNDSDMLGHTYLPGSVNYANGDVINLSIASENEIRDFIKKNVTCDKAGGFFLYPKGKPTTYEGYGYGEVPTNPMGDLEELRKDLTHKGYLKSSAPFIDPAEKNNDPAKTSHCFAPSM